MGAWDMGPFDNDGALDLLSALDGTGEACISSTLRAAMNDVVDCPDHIDNPDAQGAVAAAVLVAAKAESTRATAAERIESDVTRFLATHEFEVNDELRALAVATFDRIMTPQDNEWYELWLDAGQLEVAASKLAPFRDMLNR